MRVRHALPEDLPRMLEIYAHAREFMVATGNPRQWAARGWPPEGLVREDIVQGRAYVCENDEGRVVGSFCYMCGPHVDPCYEDINGVWRSVELMGEAGNDYGVVHRIASDGSEPGIGKFCIRWAAGRCHHLRMDTHVDNRIMQRTLESLGFVRCGTIHVYEDGDPRIAYELLEGASGHGDAANEGAANEGAANESPAYAVYDPAAQRLVFTRLDMSRAKRAHDVLVMPSGQRLRGCKAYEGIEDDDFCVIEPVPWREETIRSVSCDLADGDTIRPQAMCAWFAGHPECESIDLGGFDTSQVYAMAELFSGCSSLTSLDLSDFDTRGVMSMLAMFEGCSSLASLDVAGFDMSRVGEAQRMFCGCVSLDPSIRDVVAGWHLAGHANTYHMMDGVPGHEAQGDA